MKFGCYIATRKHCQPISSVQSLSNDRTTKERAIERGALQIGTGPLHEYVPAQLNSSQPMHIDGDGVKKTLVDE